LCAVDPISCFTSDKRKATVDFIGWKDIILAKFRGSVACGENGCIIIGNGG
jgi:hypothetical protein